MVYNGYNGLMNMGRGWGINIFEELENNINLTSVNFIERR